MYLERAVLIVSVIGSVNVRVGIRVNVNGPRPAVMARAGTVTCEAVQTLYETTGEAFRATVACVVAHPW